MIERILNTGEAKICGGCSKSPYWCATGYACSVYEDPRNTYGYRFGECAFNQKIVKQAKEKTKGQRKQRKLI